MAALQKAEIKYEAKAFRVSVLTEFLSESYHDELTETLGNLINKGLVGSENGAFYLTNGCKFPGE